MLEKPHNIPVRHKNVIILARYMDENKGREQLKFCSGKAETWIKWDSQEENLTPRFSALAAP